MPLPTDRTIDGHDIWPLMTAQPNAVSPHEAFYCYYEGNLCAVRDPRWKLVLPHRYRTLDGRPGGKDGVRVRYSHKESGLELYDLHADIGETRNVADQHPEVVQRLQKHVELAREQFGDRLVGKQGSAARPHGRLAGGE